MRTLANPIGAGLPNTSGYRWAARLRAVCHAVLCIVSIEWHSQDAVPPCFTSERRSGRRADACPSEQG